MPIDFEPLGKIDKMDKTLNLILKKLSNNTNTKWLSSHDAAKYICYSYDSLMAKVKSKEFVLNKHYYKKAKKLIFDANELDSWVRGIETTEDIAAINNKVEEIYNDVLQNIA